MSRSNFALLMFAFILTIVTLIFNGVIVFIHYNKKHTKISTMFKYLCVVNLGYIILLCFIVFTTSCAAKEESEVYSHVVVTTHSGELIYDYEGQCQIIHLNDKSNRILKIIEEDGTIKKVNIDGSTVCLIK